MSTDAAKAESKKSEKTKEAGSKRVKTADAKSVQSEKKATSVERNWHLLMLKVRCWVN